MATPVWSAARSGLLGDTGAVNAATQVNQFLGTHGITAVYQGSPVLTPSGSGGTAWAYQLSTQDVSQPFTMSGTTIGRVVVPLLPVGQGADLIVSLCANNSGVPGAVITQTRIPASWISQLAAVSGVAGPSSSAPLLQYTNSPLTLAQFNSLHASPASYVNWTLPTVSGGGGPASFPVTTVFGNYFIQVGGYTTGFTFLSSAFTIQFDALGNLSQAIPQPPMPTAMSQGASAVSVDANGNATLVVTGGTATNGGSAINTVYTAQFNSATGVISSWSSQATLPTAVFGQSMAAYNGFVYVIGGATGSGAGTPVSNVVYAQVQNGQIASWNTTTPLPVALILTYTAAIDGFLFVAGGSTGGSGLTLVYFAAINSNGSLGPWQTGPVLPSGHSNSSNQQLLPTGIFGVALPDTSAVTALGVSPNGPDIGWQAAPTASINTFAFAALAAGTPGTWQFYGLEVSTPSQYSTLSLSLTPRISVPLPTTGLSNGTTYHLVLSQPNGTPSDYLRTHDDSFVFPGNPTLLTRTKGSSTWTAGTSQHAVPIQVYDQTVIGKVQHLWEDSGARISTLAWGTTPNQPLLGLLEATSQPGPVLNQWPTFVQGIGPWHPTGGTFVQSSAHTQGNLPFSGLLTPSGSASLSYAESDLVPVQQGHSYALTAWYYSPTAYSNVSVSVNWFDVNRNFITSTSGTATSIPANTWTQFQTTVTNNVANAVYLDFVAIEGSTPPATALLYVSTATVQDKSGPQVSTVAQYEYSGTWPSAGTLTNAPTGITVVA